MNKEELRNAIIQLLEKRGELEVDTVINFLGLNGTRRVKDMIREIFKELGEREKYILLQKRGKFILKKINFLTYKDLKFLDDLEENKLNIVYKKILEFDRKRYKFLLCKDGEGLFLIILVEKLKELYDHYNDKLILLFMREKAYKMRVNKKEAYLIFSYLIKNKCNERDIINLLYNLELEELKEKKEEDRIKEELEELKRILEV